MSFDFSVLLSDDWVIHTQAQGSPETAINFFWQSYKQKYSQVSPALHLLATERTTVSVGQLVTPNENSGDVFENALYMTHTRGERESACLEKRVCWCSPAFLINFILTLHPPCAASPSCQSSLAGDPLGEIVRITWLLKKLQDDTAPLNWNHT